MTFILKHARRSAWERFAAGALAGREGNAPAREHAEGIAKRASEIADYLTAQWEKKFGGDFASMTKDLGEHLAEQFAAIEGAAMPMDSSGVPEHKA